MPDLCQPVRKSNLFQIAAAIKAVGTDFFQLFRQCDLFQSFTIIECEVVDLLQCIGKRTCSKLSQRRNAESPMRSRLPEN